MASYRAELKSGKKGSAAQHSRYDTRTGKKYEEKEDLLAFEYGNFPEWSPDHLTFWKNADKYERSNAAAYREWIISLPNEFDVNANIRLGREMVAALVGDRPWQMALHGPEGELTGIPNPHIHVMFSDRAPDGIARTPQQYFSRYNSKHPERGGCRKLSGGQTRQQMREELIADRKTIADIQNQALTQAGLDIQVDHRSLRDQGIDRKPGVHLGPAKVKRMTREAREAYATDNGGRARSSKGARLSRDMNSPARS